MNERDQSLETSAMLMRRVPMPWFGHSGTLRMGDGRLRFVDSDDAIVFDHPLREFHSIAPRAGGVGFDVWHDDTRYRVHPLQQRFTQSEHHGDMVRLGVKVASTKWCEFLVPKVSAEPPPGVKVRRPWSSFVHGLVVIASSIGIVAVATFVPLLFF